LPKEPVIRLSLLESTDGIQWKRLGTLDVASQTGSPFRRDRLELRLAWFENGVWNLFYERRDAGIWLARSTDLKSGPTCQTIPLIAAGPEAVRQCDDCHESGDQNRR
jgi:beta-1,2-mannobiose phosphorylase / 1,2-beta-oligomannan phosphorylase